MNITLQKVLDYIYQYNLIKNGDKILLALSGGSDSVFLFYFLLKFKELLNIEFECLHVNHNLRGNDSKEDAVFCLELGKVNNIKVHIKDIDVISFSKKEKHSIEEAARILRYNELIDFKEKYNFTKIATAHNLDDNIETVLFRLIEGTGLKGLTGIPIIRENNIIRPLLCLSKIEINNFLVNNKITWREDISNLDTKYKRNFIRHKLIPIIKKISPNYRYSISKTISTLSGFAEYLNGNIQNLILQYVNYYNDKIIIDLNLLQNQIPTIYVECIKVILEEKYNYRFDWKDYEKIAFIKNLQTGKYLELKDKIILLKDRSSVVIFRKTNFKNELLKFEIGKPFNIGDNFLYSEIINIEEANLKEKENNVEYLDLDKLEINSLFIRNVQNGDKIIPLGLKGSKKVNDLLTDMKVEAYKKKEIKVLLNLNEIVYVIGYKINNKYKLNEKTKRVLKLWID